MAKFQFKSYEDTALHLMQHAGEQANYIKGWDVVAETMSVQEIADYLRVHKIWSLNGAIAHFSEQVKFRREAMKDAVNA